MNAGKMLTLATACALVGACSTDKLEIPNYNAPATEAVGKDPQRVQLLATGMVDRERALTVRRVRDAAVFGREGYYYFPTDARFVSNALVGSGTPRRVSPTGFYGATTWFEAFRQGRNAVNLIAVADSADATIVTDAQKRATAGFAKTFRALALSHVLETRDSLGTPVDILADPGIPAPFVSRDSAYRFISGLLDQAKTDLQAGGPSFPFALPSGYAGFNTPTTFLKFNRAIAARVLVYRATYGCGNTCFTQALSTLAESFITTPTSPADLDIGVYSNYSTATGDTPNGLSYLQDPATFAHESFVTDAQKKANGSADDRLTRKVVALPTPAAAPQGLGIPAKYRFNVYQTPSSPIPVIRNEELVLLRAEANIGLGNLTAALPDINAIRTVSGGLPALGSLGSQSQAVTELLYNRRYSLMLEGMRWNDYRRYKILNTLPKDLATHFIAIVQPIPQAECDARPAPKPNGC